MPRAVKRPSPLSLRLSEAERAALERRAGGRALSSYVKSALFEEPAGTSRGSRGRPLTDKVLLAQLLGQLGASGLGHSLARLAEAAATGSLYIDDLTTHRLQNACDDLRGMHWLLLKALGKKVPKHVLNPQRLTVQFNRATFDPGSVE